MNNLNFSNVESALRRRLQSIYKRDMPAIFGVGDFIAIRKNNNFDHIIEVSMDSLSGETLVHTWGPVKGYNIENRRVTYIEITADSLSELMVKHYMELYE